MRILSLPIFLSLLFFFLNFCTYCTAAKPPKGDAILRTLLEHVATRGRLGCDINFDISGTGKGIPYNFSGRAKVAFDLRSKSREEIAVEASSAIDGTPVRVIASSRGLKVHFWANVSGEPPMAYTLDFSNVKNTKKSSNSAGTKGSPFSPREANNIFSNIIRETQKGLTPEGRKNLVEQSLKRASKYTLVKYVSPNCLRFIPKKGQKKNSELYYDRQTKLVKTLTVIDTHSKVTAKFVFSNWHIDEDASFPQTPGSLRYRDFDQQALGKILGTVMRLLSSNNSSSPEHGSNNGEVQNKEMEDKLRALDSLNFKLKIKAAQKSATEAFKSLE